MSFTVQVRTKGARARTTQQNANSAMSDISSSSSSAPRLTITRFNSGETTQRSIVKLNRGPKIVLANGMVVDSGNSSATPASSSTTAGGRKISLKGTKRKSGDVTTFTRTITNDDMQDTETDEAVQESASKRGRVKAPERIISKANGASFAITIPAASLIASSSAAPSSSFPASSGFSLPKPQPLLSAFPLSSSSSIVPPVKFSSDLRQKVANAAMERVAAQKATQAGASGPKKVTTTPTTAGQPAPVASSVAPAASPSPPAAGVASSSPVSSERPTVVLVRNLAPAVNARFLLTHLFGLFDVASLTLDTDPVTHACNGTAEVVFSRAADAQEAVSLCQGQLLLGQPAKLSIIEQRDTPASPTPDGNHVTKSVSANAIASGPPLLPAGTRPLSQQQAFSAKNAPILTALATSSTGPLFSAANADAIANVGFVWEGDENAAQNGEETIFNITNLKLPASYTASVSSSTRPLNVASSSVGPAVSKKLQVRPKSVVVSSADATASAAATTSGGKKIVTKSGIEVTPSGKPSFTTKKHV